MYFSLMSCGKQGWLPFSLWVCA